VDQDRADRLVIIMCWQNVRVDEMVSELWPPKTCTKPVASRKLAHKPHSSSGQETDGADKDQADCPYEIEIEPASGEEFQTEPGVDEERKHAAGDHH